MIGVYERNSELYVEVASGSEAHQQGLAVGEHRVPSMRVICPDCSGAGAQPFRLPEEEAPDPDLLADIANGFYDTDCTTCDGGGVLVEIDTKRLEKNAPLHTLVKSQGGG
jgi:hypothetical protein